MGAIKHDLNVNRLIKKVNDIVVFYLNSPTATAAFRKIQGKNSTVFVQVYLKNKFNIFLYSFILNRHVKLVGIRILKC